MIVTALSFIFNLLLIISPFFFSFVFIEEKIYSEEKLENALLSFFLLFIMMYVTHRGIYRMLDFFEIKHYYLIILIVLDVINVAIHLGIVSKKEKE